MFLSIHWEHGVVSEGRAVTQTDNHDKTQIQVKWRAPEPALYFFSAAFVQSFDVFWLRKAIILPTTTTAQTTTSLNTETESTLGKTSAYSSILNTTFGQTTGTTATTYITEHHINAYHCEDCPTTRPNRWNNGYCQFYDYNTSNNRIIPMD
ncbi:hypothetical protein AOLI_G00008310 [Acnodon oligacanthus]